MMPCKLVISTTILVIGSALLSSAARLTVAMSASRRQHGGNLRRQQRAARRGRGMVCLVWKVSVASRGESSPGCGWCRRDRNKPRRRSVNDDAFVAPRDVRM